MQANAPNPYQAPQPGPDDLTRPHLRYRGLIALVCSLQLLGALWSLLASHPDWLHLSANDLFTLILALLYPALLCCAGILLFLQNVFALPAFACYLCWGMSKSLSEASWDNHLTLLGLCAIFAYAIWPKKMSG